MLTEVRWAGLAVYVIMWMVTVRVLFRKMEVGAFLLPALRWGKMQRWGEAAGWAFARRHIKCR